MSHAEPNIVLCTTDFNGYVPIAIDVLFNVSPIFKKLFDRGLLLCEGTLSDPQMPYSRVTVNLTCSEAKDLMGKCIECPTSPHSKHATAGLVIAISLAPSRGRQQMVQDEIDRLSVPELYYHFEDAVNHGYPKLVNAIVFNFLRSRESLAPVYISSRSPAATLLWDFLKSAQEIYERHLYLDGLDEQFLSNRSVKQCIYSTRYPGCRCRTQRFHGGRQVTSWVATYLSDVRAALNETVSLSMLKNPKSIRAAYENLHKVRPSCETCRCSFDHEGEINPGSAFDLFVNALQDELRKQLTGKWDDMYRHWSAYH